MGLAGGGPVVGGLGALCRAARAAAALALPLVLPLAVRDSAAALGPAAPSARAALRPGGGGIDDGVRATGELLHTVALAGSRPHTLSHRNRRADGAGGTPSGHAPPARVRRTY